MAIVTGRRGRRRTMVEINVTPLTDVCLVLLVIFMCTAKFLGAGEAVDVELPGASTSQPMDDVDAIDVSIAADGRVVIDGELVPPDQLVAAFLRQSLRLGPSPVVLNADQGAPYGLVYAVMDAARMANLTSVSLAAEPRPMPPSAPSPADGGAAPDSGSVPAPAPGSVPAPAPGPSAGPTG
jgi:biopolymer transport protein ExbD